MIPTKWIMSETKNTKNPIQLVACEEHKMLIVKSLTFDVLELYYGKEECQICEQTFPVLEA